MIRHVDANHARRLVFGPSNMDMNPSDGGGVLGWIMTGFVAALLALLVGYFVPSLIPTRITKTQI